MRIAVIVAFVALLSGCNSHAPDAGHEIVLVQKPWLFDHGGVADDSVKTGRAQQQRVQTEMQRKLAEDARLKAEQARAAADNAYRESMHMSPEQFLQLEMIKMQAEVCGTEGKANCTFIQNGATPVYNLGR